MLELQSATREFTGRKTREIFDRYPMLSTGDVSKAKRKLELRLSQTVQHWRKA